MMEWRRKTSKKDGGKQGTRIKNKSEEKAQGQNKGKENAEWCWQEDDDSDGSVDGGENNDNNI